MSDTDRDRPAPPHRRVAFRPGRLDDDVRSEEEELDPIDKASADSFPASDPPSTSSPQA